MTQGELSVTVFGHQIRLPVNFTLMELLVAMMIEQLLAVYLLYVPPLVFVLVDS